MELDIKRVDLYIFNISTRKFEEKKSVQLNISENEKNEKIYKFRGEYDVILKHFNSYFYTQWLYFSRWN